MVVVLWQNWGEYVGRQLPHFLASATLTDVTITVGPRSVRAHRIILAFFSTFFKKMLEDVCEERPMVLVFPGINFEALEVIINYMYRGQVNVTTELLPQVIELSKMLKVKGLIELPAQLDSMISNSNSKIGINEDGISAQDTTEMSICEDGEGLVELEVTATGDASSVNHILTSEENNVIHQVIHAKPHQENLNSNNVPSSNNEIESASIQLSTVSELSHNQMVKLASEGSIGEVSEVLFPGDYMQSQEPEEIDMQDSNLRIKTSTVTSNPEEGNSLQISQEDSQPKKKRKTKNIQRYSPDHLQRALEDLWSGLGTLREIAERWGVPHSTLSVNARLAGIPIKQRQLDYDNDTLEAAMEAVKAGTSYMKVARDFNVPKSVLWRRCKREGIIRDTDSPKRYFYSEQDLQHARTMLMEGRGLSCIVKEKKIPKTTLFRLKETLIREGKLPAASISRVTQPRRPSEESLKQAIQACKDDGMSQGQASEKFQVSKTTVWRRMKRLKQMNVEEETNKSNRPPEASGSQEEMKIEVVNEFSDSQLSEAYETISYTDGEFADIKLMNLPGGGYQVVGSEIVIGGQQMVVLEPSLEPSEDNQISTNDRSDDITQNHHLVVTSFSQMEGLESLGKEENSGVSIEQIPGREGNEVTHS